MPATSIIDHDARIVRSRAWGILSDSDLEGTQATLHADPRFDPMYRQVYDFSGVTEVQVTGEFVRRLARNSLFSPHARRAVVVNSDVAFGLARMFGLVGDRDPDSFMIFRDIQSAEDWIDSPE